MIYLSWQTLMPVTKHLYHSRAGLTLEENCKQLSDRNINLLQKDTVKAFMITCVVAVYHAQHVLQSVVDELN